MTEEQYNERMKKIEADFDQAKKKLYIEYGLSQAKYKVGDIIRDSRWTMLIDRVTVSKTFGLPEPVYNGVELKKDLTPKANSNRVSIYGNNGIELVKSNEIEKL